MTSTQEILDFRGTAFAPLERPARVVSLVPSITELLFDLGLTEDEVVGRTRFCIHPEGRVKSVPSVGGTKDFKIQRIVMHDPDIILANVDENRQDDIELLESVFPKGRVFVTHPNTFDDAIQMVRDIGALFNAEERANTLADEMCTLRRSLAGRDPVRVLYMIWMKPFMTAAPGTFIHDMLKQAGKVNAIDEAWIAGKSFDSEGKARYPELTPEEIVALKPEQILLSSEPYPFKEKHKRFLHRQLSKVDKEFTETLDIKLVDGEHYSWYGSRMLQALRAFAAEEA